MKRSDRGILTECSQGKVTGSRLVAWITALALLCTTVTTALPGTAPALADQDSPSGQLERAVLAPAPRLPLIKPAPDFTLLDTSGRPIRLSELRGKVVLISFIYTTCSITCPLLAQRMGLLQARLARAGLQGREVHLLSVTVDPDRDSAEALSRYAARLRAASGGWRFLREAPERLRPVLAAYDEWTRTQPDGDIDHPARLYLIDRRGNVREIYSLSFFDERQAFLDIRALLKEAP